MMAEFELRVESTKYDPEDDRWQTQVNELEQQLQRELGIVRRESTPVDGSKGDIATVILALGTAGTFTAAVEMLRLWLSRGRDRSITLVKREKGKETLKVSVTTRGVSEKTISDVYKDAAQEGRE